MVLCVCVGVHLTMPVFSRGVLDHFSTHSLRMREAARARRAAVQLRSVVDDSADAVAVDVKDTLGVRLPNDRWAGCTNLRTLRALLTMIDDRGFERSPHQVPLPALAFCVLCC